MVSYFANTYNGVVYMSLDAGISWNFRGLKYPTDDCWTWCTTDQSQIINYVNNLWLVGLIPIFYSFGATYHIVKVIRSFFKPQPLVFINNSLDKIHQQVLKECKFIEDYKIFNIGPTSLIATNYNLEDINIDPLHKLDHQTPQLLILMGQPGNGKTTLANRLVKKGWIVIDDKNAAQIQRLASTNSQIYVNFEILISTAKSKNLKIVIDGENARFNDRQIFIDTAKKYHLLYLIGWVTKPSYYHYNGQRNIPSEILDHYHSLLEAPKEHAIQLV